MASVAGRGIIRPEPDLCGVGGGLVAHVAHVGIRLVVGEDRVGPPPGGGEVTAAGAQVRGGTQGGIVDIERVGFSVAVPVPPSHLPGGGNELHWSDGVVPESVAVQDAVVRVRDGGETVAVEAGADNGPACLPGGSQASAAVGSVGGFYEADGRHRVPPDPARRGGGVGQPGRGRIGPERSDGYVGPGRSPGEPLGVKAAWVMFTAGVLLVDSTSSFASDWGGGGLAPLVSAPDTRSAQKVKPVMTKNAKRIRTARRFSRSMA